MITQGGGRRYGLGDMTRGGSGSSTSTTRGTITTPGQTGTIGVPDNSQPYIPPDTPVSTNQAAANVFASIGVPATCFTVNTNTPGANFNQNVCTVPGTAPAYDAGLTTALSPAQVATIVGQERAASGGISSSVFDNQNNTIIGTPVSNSLVTTPASPLSLLGGATASPVGSGTVVQAVVQAASGGSSSGTPGTAATVASSSSSDWLSSLFAYLGGNQQSTQPTIGPGISYNDINPDGSAVQSSSSGTLTDIFSILDQGISVMGVNIPLWLLGVGGYFAFKAFSGGSSGQPARVRGITYE